MAGNLITGLRVPPVVTLERAEDAIPLACAMLADGGIEIASHTPAALDALLRAGDWTRITELASEALA